MRGGGDDACGSSGGDSVKVVAPSGVVIVWFRWVVGDYFVLKFGVVTICGRSFKKGGYC